MLCGGKTGHVRPHLGYDPFSRPLTNARNGGEQRHRLRPRERSLVDLLWGDFGALVLIHLLQGLHPLLDLLSYPADSFLQGIHVGQVLAEKEAVMGLQRADQGLLKCRPFGF